jgi:subtilisin
MIKYSERGFSQIVVIVFLVLAIAGGVILVQRQSNLNSKASKTDDKSYIVVYKNLVEDPTHITNEIALAHMVNPDKKYEHAIKGFSAKLNDDQLEKIKKDPRVKFVSEDKEIKIDAPAPRPTKGPKSTPTPTPTATRSPKPSPSPSVVSTQMTPNGVKRMETNTNSNKGLNVGVAILDTGVDLNHPDLVGQITGNKSCVTNILSGQDDQGHGTAVAGIVAATDNFIGTMGVASQAKIIAVKVLNSTGSGSWSDVICGIDWAIANASTYNIKVINLSMSSPGSTDNNCGNTNFDALHTAICKARDAGITVVASAGNSGQDASTYIPASYDDAVITVSALNDTDGMPGGLGAANGQGADDTFPGYSNFGNSVDLGAPGSGIYTTQLGGGYTDFNMTSAAAPHVAGAAALYISTNPAAQFAQVLEGLKAKAELINQGHTDPSGNHPEPVIKANSL